MDATQDDVTQPEDVDHPPPPRRERVAARLVDGAATVWFLLANMLWWATWLPTEGYGADRGGSYGILTLILSFEAIVLTIAVLIKQKLSDGARDRQAEADLKNNAIAAEAAIKLSDQLDRLEQHFGNGSGSA